MDTYWNLSEVEREAVENALDELRGTLAGIAPLANDDRSAHAAEALAVYIVASRT